jgi:hypothetical protein
MRELVERALRTIGDHRDRRAHDRNRKPVEDRVLRARLSETIDQGGRRTRVPAQRVGESRLRPLVRPDGQAARAANGRALSQFSSAAAVGALKTAICVASACDPEPRIVADGRQRAERSLTRCTSPVASSNSSAISARGQQSQQFTCDGD